jgi:hypothetical protein
MNSVATIFQTLLAVAIFTINSNAQESLKEDPFAKYGVDLKSRIQALARDWQNNNFFLAQRITLGDFIYKGDPNGVNTGFMIKEYLIEALKNEGFKFSDSDNDWTCKIEAKYELKKIKENALIDIMFNFINPENKSLMNIPVRRELQVKGAPDIARLAAISVALTGDGIEQKKQLISQLENKSVFIDKQDESQVLRKEKGNPYGFEVLVLNPNDNVFKPRTINARNGISRINFSRGEVFRIRLVNDSDKPAAAEVILDGLNVFNAAEDSKLHNARFILQPKSNTVVSSWVRKEGVDGGNEFKVGRIADAYASKVLGKDKAKSGMISVVFSQAWEQGNPPPEIPPAGRASDESDKGIILGDANDVMINIANYDWSNYNTSVLHIRYDLPE